MLWDHIKHRKTVIINNKKRTQKETETEKQYYQRFYTIIYIIIKCVKVYLVSDLNDAEWIIFDANTTYEY